MHPTTLYGSPPPLPPSPSFSSSMAPSRSLPETMPPSLPHVLVVDDSPLDRKILERLLHNSSYTVTAVDSGKKALELLDSVDNNIDLIFTDYCMPEMSGYELLRQVKETTAFRDIPVVVMSSENVSSRIEMCLKDGAEEFVLKPVRLADAKRLTKYLRCKIPTQINSTVEQNILPVKINAAAEQNKLPVQINAAAEQSTVPCNKRKFSSDGFEVQNAERRPRPRPNGVIVA